MDGRRVVSEYLENFMCYGEKLFDSQNYFLEDLHLRESARYCI